MQLTVFASQLAGIPIQTMFPPPGSATQPLAAFSSDAQGNYKCTLWNVPNVTMPTPAQLAAAVSAATPTAQLAISLVSRASVACSAVTSQVVPDATHQNAYMSAATIVGPSATVPTVEPAKSAFANMAGAFGMDPQSFATLVTEVASVSLTLSAILATLTSTATAQDVTTQQLNSALTQFESSLNELVTQINAVSGLTVTVVAPPAITIVGINA